MSQTTRMHTLMAEIVFHSIEGPLFIYRFSYRWALTYSFKIFSTGSLGIIHLILHLLWAHHVPCILPGVWGGKQYRYLNIVVSDEQGAFSFFPRGRDRLKIGLYINLGVR